VSSPHDALVKAIFEDPAHMRGELEAVLPPQILRDLDLSTLTLVPGNLLEKSQLQARYTDMLFRVLTHAGEEVLIHYVLAEHRSTPDDEVLDRLLFYQVLIWQRWREQGGEGPRPPILVVLVYQGPRRWKVPREFAESYGPSVAADDWRASVLNFRVFVDDLTAETDERLRARAMTDVGKLALLTLCHARDDDLMDRLEQWADLWAAVSRARSGLMALAAIVSYIGKVSASPSPERLMRLIPVDAEEARVMVPTLFERLQEEGRQMGWHKGLQEGREKGREEGLREAISKLLRQRFGELAPEMVQRIEQADAATLDRWMERVLTAPSLAAVLA